MTAYLKDAAGRKYLLPALLSWDVSHGFCSPCDSFEVSFLYDREMLYVLREACRFSAEYGGETVFSGVADEFELSAGADGCVCVLRGRGLQALLLDSEAERAEYYNADTEYILSRHVRPFGVTDVSTGAAGGRTASFSVSSGESHWSVVKRFTEFCLGVRPRFTPAGRLLLDGAKSGRTFTVDADTPVTAQTYGQDRYGVISEVIVKNRVLETSVTVENAAFQALGGKCVRIVNVPRTVQFDAMRHTGAYQIAQSERDFVRCRLTVPQCFAAFPGDTAALESSPLGITGSFTVTASRCFANGKSAGTVLDLRESV